METASWESSKAETKIEKNIPYIILHQVSVQIIHLQVSPKSPL